MNNDNAGPTEFKAATARAFTKTAGAYRHDAAIHLAFLNSEFAPMDIEPAKKLYHQLGAALRSSQ